MWNTFPHKIINDIRFIKFMNIIDIYFIWLEEVSYSEESLINPDV